MPEWWVVLLVIFAVLVTLLGAGLPVAFAFLLISIAGAAILQGGEGAFQQMIHSIYGSVTSFSLLPIPLFVFMGEILWHSSIATRALERARPPVRPGSGTAQPSDGDERNGLCCVERINNRQYGNAR